LNSLDKLIINAAITGNVLTKGDTKHLPVTTAEIVDCARQVQDAGASIVHLHARNHDQAPSSDGKVYCELVEHVREACDDIIICVSLSGRHVSEVEQRAAALESRPELASLTIGSMNFPQQANVNPPNIICELASRIYASGAMPELEVFEAGFISYANHLIKKGVLRPPHYFNLLLGSLCSAPLDLLGLSHMVSLLPTNSIWSVGGIGRCQLDANVIAIAAGGHVRVGLEDNIYLDRQRTMLTDNLQLIRRIAGIAHEMGREPASPAEVRQILGLPTAASLRQKA
jgi:3-keto-5-aminohexanoate cleavage enzyme